MNSESDIPAAFAATDAAFVPYLALGDPDVDASIGYVEALAAGGADVIELGLPFSEPIAEGPTIQRAVGRSLDSGMTPERFFETIERLDIGVPLVCMTYYNLVYQYGRTGTGEPNPAPFVRRATEAGIDGFVVPDLPAEESGPLRAACDDYGRDLIVIVAPTTRGERLATLVERSSGYVYVQARLGVTSAREDVSDRTAESLDRLVGYDIPKAVGFGISTRDHAREIVAAGADGIIVGSALVDVVADGYENGDDTTVVAERLETKAHELKQGALSGVAQRAPRPERT